MRIYRLDVSSGVKELWKEIRPADPAGFIPFYFIHLTPDGKWCVYTYSRFLSDLYLIEGLR